MRIESGNVSKTRARAPHAAGAKVEGVVYVDHERVCDQR